MLTKWIYKNRSLLVISAGLLAGLSVFGARSAYGGLLGGKDPRFEIKYQPPAEPTVSLSIGTPGTVENIFYVDVCSNKRWERAAFFAPGMYRTGALIVSERRLTDKMRPKATPMPEMAEINIPAGKRVLIAVTSNVSGVSLSNLTQCSLVAAVETRATFSYQGTWNISEQACSLQVTEIAAGEGGESSATLVNLTPSSSDNECKF